MSAKTKDEILGFNDVTIKEVDVPEWNTKVHVRSLSGERRNAYEMSLIRRQKTPQGGIDILPDTANRNARLAVLGICDDAGDLLFRPEDAPSLGQKNAGALQRICDAIEKISGMADDAIEDAEGDSNGAHGADSVSSEPKQQDSQ